MDREPEPPTIALNGRFSNLESIGSGGMARVYRATDSTTAETVAVKILRPEGAQALSLESEGRRDSPKQR